MIRTKVIATRLVPKGNIIAITLFGLVFTRDKRYVDRYVLNHELIHCKQQLELLYLPFFVLYLMEWLILTIKYGDKQKGYRMISFEQEAYDNQNDLNYLKKRKPYAWLRYLHR